MITKQSGIQPAAVGGIAGGIVGGFLLLGAGIAFFLLRRQREEVGGEQVYYPEEQSARDPEADRFESIYSPTGRYGST